MFTSLIFYYWYVGSMMYNRTLDSYNSFTVRNKLHPDDNQYNNVNVYKSNFMTFFDFRALQKIDPKTHDIFQDNSD